MLGIFRAFNNTEKSLILHRKGWIRVSLSIRIVNFPAKFTLFCAPAILTFIACQTSHSFSSTSRKLELQDVIDIESERSHTRLGCPGSRNDTCRGYDLRPPRYILNAHAK